jgi:SWIM zinc finger
VLLAYEPKIDIPRLAEQSGLSADRVRRALGRLGAAGRVGYDAHEDAYFHRELPYDPAALDAMHPRLRDAKALVEQSAVRFDGDVAHVRSGDVDYVVRAVAGGHRCSCPWYAKHQGTRGPCKHVLAVELTKRG